MSHYCQLGHCGGHSQSDDPAAHAATHAQKAHEHREDARQVSIFGFFGQDANSRKEWFFRVADGEEPEADSRSTAYISGPGTIPRIMAPIHKRWDPTGIYENGLALLKSASLGGGFGTVAAFFAQQEARRRLNAHIQDCYTTHVFKGLCVVRWPKHWGIPMFNPIPSNWTPRGYFNFSRQRMSFFVLGHSGATFTCEQQDYRQRGEDLKRDPTVAIFGGSEGPAIDLSLPQTWNYGGVGELGEFLQQMEKEGWLAAFLNGFGC